MRNNDFDPKSPGDPSIPNEEDNLEFSELDSSIDEENSEYIENEAPLSTLDDEEDCDNYGRSGEKYGWYNGWSDDVIDDAFEGDPENTWNVD